MGQTDSQSQEDEEVDVCAIQTLYKSFIMECPSGSLYLHEFKKIFGIKNDDTPESLYMDNLFRSFDMNGDDVLDFIEYVAALHLVLRGKLEDKLRWSFKVFDKDENGRLDRDELKQIIKIIYKLKNGQMYDDAGRQLTVDEMCERLFDTIDKNGDGHISLDEFLEGSQEPWIRNCLQLDVNPCAWVNQHQDQISGYKKPISKDPRLRDY